MIDMAPHLTFYGRCREALEFYATCLDGQISSCITFGEANVEVQQYYKDKILTSFFEAQGLMFYASDGVPGQPIATEGNIALQIESFDKGELKYIYSRFENGGKEVAPLKIVQNDVLYGVVRDKYNINWIFIGLN